MGDTPTSQPGPVLVTGGAGYIGSHACKHLLERGHPVVALDSLVRGHRTPMDLLGGAHPDRFRFVHADLGDPGAIAGLIDGHRIDTVMHFGAYAYVGESVEHPLAYWRNNTERAIAMLRGIDDATHPIRSFVFSSSCATYGSPATTDPIDEQTDQRPESPYGWTKMVYERALEHWAHARAARGAPVALSVLRYFNVAGADTTGLLGEDHDPETHLIPVAIQAALGRRDSITVHGTDYPTPDGTCVRDYIHVDDLVRAHILVMDKVGRGSQRAYNLGIGRGTSVREIIGSVERVAGAEIRAIEGPRRAGDAVALCADSSLITEELGWRAEITDLDQMIESAWRWMRDHPGGYNDTQGPSGLG